MIAARHRWVFPDPIRLDPEFREAASARGLGPFAAAVLARRGVADPARLASFLGPAEAALSDARLLPDAAALVDRVRSARTRQERVMVFGDFDADGLTGLAQMVLALRRLGLDVLPYVPSRLDEGHGVSMSSVEAAVAAGATLIVTVDTGSTSVAEVAAARERRVDVIVTDHHHLPDAPPAVVALVNPHRADSAYPDASLSGSGVAFSVARLLLGELEDAEADALAMADLAAIGTVADVVPLLGENRAIVRLGLERMRVNPRPGIAALLAGAGVRPADVGPETVGFTLAPRLNAASRVGEALDAANLLLARTDEEAAALAAVLEEANATRRDLMRTAVAEARAGLGLADPGLRSAGRATPGGAEAAPGVAPGGSEVAVAGGRDAAALLVRGPWPVGIIGLVAGRLAEEVGKPAVVGTVVGGSVRASCRGDGRVHLARALDACDDLLVRHGGHAAAAGFEVPLASWEAFARRFLAIAEAERPDDPRPELAVDLALPHAYVDYGLYRDLARLAPCGPGNADPLVAVLGLTVARVRAANGGHTQLVLRRDRDVIDAIAFGRGDLASGLAEGDRVDVVARLSSRSFGGLETLQLEVRDVAPSGSHPRTAAVLEHVAGRAGDRPVGERLALPSSGGIP